MNTPTPMPSEIRLNAWTGTEEAHGQLGAQAAWWGEGQDGMPQEQQVLEFGPDPPMTAWRDPKVGYGVLLRDDESDRFTDAQKAAGADAPGPVQDLLAAREGSVVLRWSPDAGLGDDHLRRYYADGSPFNDPAIGLSDFGVANDCLPKYVAIIGGPEAIPWSVQYSLGTRHAVGRIPLQGDALDRYVHALITDWEGAEAVPDQALVWTVDCGDVMTRLMRTVISHPLAKALSPPPLAGFQEIVGPQATGSALSQALGTTRPGLVVTSSHGLVEPFDDPDALRATLGLPVDQNRVPVTVEQLSADLPGGCIWFAQACCSAGGAGASLYTALLEPQWPAAATVEAVAQCGPVVAPAALEVLGRKNPVRAVLGHVEPTFSWTLQVKSTGQILGGRIVNALSSKLYDGVPLAHAFADYRADVGQLYYKWFTLQARLNDDADTRVLDEMRRIRLAALDRQSLVLLGDPTVSLPPCRATAVP
ncbi:hypothetical protein OG982_26555 [Streptomyces sp. NBC_01551]|uniref:hypothetical protein n=1 Tax=Streptomyces sp. NBC_01551 TaxID=2975876 RepID=UPI00224CE059|nr:hypothetical protein [Streptomyces sp. NBC_01551]MCX4529211.1 hypothetical protein [Streptomyces sp. NBC_01551]